MRPSISIAVCGIPALECEQGREAGLELKSYALHDDDGRVLISGVLAGFVSRIDVVTRRVPGTQ